MSSLSTVRSTSTAESFFSQAVHALVRGAAQLVRAVQHRRDVQQLLTLDERALKDIGLVRNDVLIALAEPMGADPSTVLRLRSAEHRARLRSVETHVRAVRAPRT